MMPTFRKRFTHAVVILHTHSDEDTGDLFYTSGGGKEKSPLGIPIETVSSPSKTPYTVSETHKS